MRKKILLIDDELILGSLMPKLLPEYELRQELTGGCGLAAVYIWEPDLVLLDIRLPDVRGEAILKQIRRDWRLDELPIIVLSASVGGEEGKSGPAELHGCPAFGKPFNVEELRSYVDFVLQGSGGARSGSRSASDDGRADRREQERRVRCDMSAVEDGGDEGEKRETRL